MRISPPDSVFLISLTWLNRCKEFFFWDISEKTVNEEAFLTKTSALHLCQVHPGEITNKPLLKNFDYVRVDTADRYEPEDLVCHKKIKQDTDYELITHKLWNFLEQSFGADYPIVR